MAAAPLPDLRTITSAVDFFWLIHRASDRQVADVVIQLREDFPDWNRILYGMALAEHFTRMLAAGGDVPADHAELIAMLDAPKDACSR